MVSPGRVQSVPSKDGHLLLFFTNQWSVARCRGQPEMLAQTGRGLHILGLCCMDNLMAVPGPTHRLLDVLDDQVHDAGPDPSVQAFQVDHDSEQLHDHGH